MVHCSCKDGGKTFVPSVFPVSNDIVAAMVINFVVQILWQNVQAISACFALAKQLACNSDNNKVVMWVTSCMSITTSAWDEDTNNWLSKQHNPTLINQFLLQRVLTLVDSHIYLMRVLKQMFWLGCFPGSLQFLTLIVMVNGLYFSYSTDHVKQWLSYAVHVTIIQSVAVTCKTIN